MCVYDPGPRAYSLPGPALPGEVGMVSPSASPVVGGSVGWGPPPSTTHTQYPIPHHREIKRGNAPMIAKRDGPNPTHQYHTTGGGGEGRRGGGGALTLDHMGTCESVYKSVCKCASAHLCLCVNLNMRVYVKRCQVLYVVHVCVSNLPPVQLPPTRLKPMPHSEIESECWPLSLCLCLPCLSVSVSVSVSVRRTFT